MGEFADLTTKKASKLSSLAAEMRRMDNFRDSARAFKLHKKGIIKLVVCDEEGHYPVEINTGTLEGLTDNIVGLAEVAIKNRYDEIRTILDNEFGGAYKEVSDND